LALEPQKQYRLSGQIQEGNTHRSDFKLVFRTDAKGRPFLE